MTHTPADVQRFLEDHAKFDGSASVWYIPVPLRRPVAYSDPEARKLAEFCLTTGQPLHELSVSDALLDLVRWVDAIADQVLSGPPGAAGLLRDPGTGRFVPRPNGTGASGEGTAP